MRRKITAAVVLLAAAAVEAWRRGAFDGEAGDGASGAEPVGALEGVAGNITDTVQSMIDQTDPGTAERNLSAFLDVIAACEGTAGAPDPYRVCYGYRWTVRDMSDHPAITGEWAGEPLTEEQCRGAGITPPCRSTAAGAFQFTRGTWRGLKRRLSLPDFGPESQRAAATALLSDLGALADVKAGRLETAIAKCRRTWASLPGAGYAGQGSRSLPWVVARFEAAGGVQA